MRVVKEIEPRHELFHGAARIYLFLNPWTHLKKLEVANENDVSKNKSALHRLEHDDGVASKEEQILKELKLEALVNVDQWNWERPQNKLQEVINEEFQKPPKLKLGLFLRTPNDIRQVR